MAAEHLIDGAGMHTEPFRKRVIVERLSGNMKMPNLLNLFASQFRASSSLKVHRVRYSLKVIWVHTRWLAAAPTSCLPVVGTRTVLMCSGSGSPRGEVKGAVRRTSYADLSHTPHGWRQGNSNPRRLVFEARRREPAAPIRVVTRSPGAAFPAKESAPGSPRRPGQARTALGPALAEASQHGDAASSVAGAASAGSCCCWPRVRLPVREAACLYSRSVGEQPVSVAVAPSFPDPTGSRVSPVFSSPEMGSPFIPWASVTFEEPEGLSLHPSPMLASAWGDQSELPAPAFAEFRRLFSHVGLLVRLVVGRAASTALPHSTWYAG